MKTQPNNYLTPNVRVIKLRNERSVCIVGSDLKKYEGVELGEGDDLSN